MKYREKANLIIMDVSYNLGKFVGNIVDEFKKGYKDSKKNEKKEK